MVPKILQLYFFLSTGLVLIHFSKRIYIPHFFTFSTSGWYLRVSARLFGVCEPDGRWNASDPHPSSASICTPLSGPLHVQLRRLPLSGFWLWPESFHTTCHKMKGRNSCFASWASSFLRTSRTRCDLLVSRHQGDCPVCFIFLLCVRDLWMDFPSSSKSHILFGTLSCNCERRAMSSASYDGILLEFSQ